jgi:hypothetical protein
VAIFFFLRALKKTQNLNVKRNNYCPEVPLAAVRIATQKDQFQEGKKWQPSGLLNKVREFKETKRVK